MPFRSREVKPSDHSDSRGHYYSRVALRKCFVVLSEECLCTFLDSLGLGAREEIDPCISRPLSLLLDPPSALSYTATQPSATFPSPSPLQSQELRSCTPESNVSASTRCLYILEPATLSKKRLLHGFHYCRHLLVLHFLKPRHVLQRCPTDPKSCDIDTHFMLLAVSDYISDTHPPSPDFICASQPEGFPSE